MNMNTSEFNIYDDQLIVSHFNSFDFKNNNELFIQIQNNENSSFRINFNPFESKNNIMGI
jgi:hypothetical protein